MLRRGVVLPLQVESFAEICMQLPIEERVANASLHLKGLSEGLVSLVEFLTNEVNHADISKGQCFPPLDPQFIGEHEHSFEVAQGEGRITRCQIHGAEIGTDFDGENLEPGGLEKLKGAFAIPERRAGFAHLLVDPRNSGQTAALPDGITHRLQRRQRLLELIQRLLIIAAPYLQSCLGNTNNRLLSLVADT